MSDPSRQRGAALLILLTITVLALAGVLLARLNEAPPVTIAREAPTALALGTAKEALLAWSAGHAGPLPPPDDDLAGSVLAPGLLPCPDTDLDGWPEPLCGPGASGRVPWRLLGLAEPLDHASERIWYALGDRFRVFVVVAGGGSGGDTLVVPGVDFNALGVVAGDLAHNLDDGSIGVIQSVTGAVLGLAGLEGGQLDAFLAGHRVAIHPPVNAETSGDLTLDGGGGVAAVLMAPGPPLAGQDRSPGNEGDPARYLEGENATPGDGVFASGGGPAFNDRVLAIRDGELLGRAERRVLGELRAALAGYRAAFGHYPWLARFTDPRFPVVSGIAGPGSAGLVLVDGARSRSFAELGVRFGDAVTLIDPGTGASARGHVLTVAGGTITLTDLGGGTLGALTEGLSYRIERHAGLESVREGLLPVHREGAPFTSGFSVAWDLGDAGPGDEIGVAVGSSLAAPGSGAHATHLLRAVQHSVFARSPPQVAGLGLVSGTATGGGEDRLVDSSRDFAALGVQPGDRVFNVSDPPGSSGVVAAVSTADPGSPPFNEVLELVDPDPGDPLQGGSRNRFDPGDSYLVTSLSPGGSGPLLGELFEPEPARLGALQGTADAGTSDLVLRDDDRDFPAAGVNVGDLVADLSDGSSGVVSAVATSTLTVAALAGGAGNRFEAGHDYAVWPAGTCIWRGLGEVDCRAAVDATPEPLRFATTADSGSGGLDLVLPADVPFGPALPAGLTYVRNLVDGTISQVASIDPPGDGNGGRWVLHMSSHPLTGWSATDATFDPGEAIEIRVQTLGVTDAADPGSAGLTLRDDQDAGGSPRDFEALGVVPGDLVWNRTDGSVGVVESVGSNTLTAAALLGGSDNTFEAGDQYRLVGSFFDAGEVARRRYVLELLFSGPGSIRDRGDGQRVRDVVGAVLPVHPEGLPTVSVTDLDGGGNVLGSASLTLSGDLTLGLDESSGLERGLAVRGLRLDLRPALDLPVWLDPAGWMRTTYVGVASNAAPGADTSAGVSCPAPPDGSCLQVVLARDPSAPGDPDRQTRRVDVEALVLGAGPEREGQDRTLGTQAQYLEAENAVQGDADTFALDRASVNDAGVPVPAGP